MATGEGGTNITNIIIFGILTIAFFVFVFFIVYLVKRSKARKEAKKNKNRPWPSGPRSSGMDFACRGPDLEMGTPKPSRAARR